MPEQAPAPAPALRLDDLTVALRGRSVLRGVDMRAAHGALTALLGPNGAGKTTLLRAVMGLLEHRGTGAQVTGHIAIDGRPLGDLSRAERARNVAYLPQRSLLDAPLSVTSVVAHGRYAHVRSGALRAGDHRAIDRAIAAADIADIAQRPFNELSGGEQRRVLLARALATGARILLLDEPTAALDIGHSLALYRLLRDLAGEGYCVVIAMHDLQRAVDYTDHAVLLHRGIVAASGPTADVVADDPIAEVYGVQLAREERLSFRLPRGS